MKKFIELIIGDLESKKEYKAFMKKVNLLPNDYAFVFKKIQKYMWNFGYGFGEEIINLYELFEASAAEGKHVLDVTGEDVAAFADELMALSKLDEDNGIKLGEQVELNKDIESRVEQQVKIWTNKNK
jgi:DNA-binding ferritin-like protein (Dps family)